MSKPAKALKKGDHLYLIDGSGYLFRAYHALPPLTRKSDGLPVGAVSGYCNMMWKLLADVKGPEAPTHLAVVFDAGAVTFRNTIYDKYKANRPPPPEDLIPQFPLVRDATRAFGVSCVEMDGFEADDLIATYTRQARDAGARVTIISSDKDLMQLVEDGKVELLDTMKNKRIGTAEVMEKFGVAPSKVVEVQALAGDSVDNVPGVPGIGVKTAAELLGIYGDLETLLKRASEIKQPKRRETLMANAENARISLKLVTLDSNAKLPEGIDAFAVAEPEPKTLIAFLRGMEFNSITKRVATHFSIEDVEAIAPTLEPSATAADRIVKQVVKDEPPSSTANAVGAVADLAAIKKPLDLDAYETVTTLARLEEWIARIREVGHVCIDTETTSLDAMQAELCGVSMAVTPGEACYVPCGHRKGEGLDLGALDDLVQMNEAEVLKRLK
ncbi:MAG TPA: 5'-3' exonuclease H3TH domain-containing protein, partial [Rhizomicrobium sp.]|nr:5'-3' exonuclease H3TH domain-containing protein [Rhizomicrobium sp.]